MDLFDIVRSAPPPKSVRDRPSVSNRDSSKRSLSPSSVSTHLEISDSEYEGEAMRKKKAAKSKKSKFTCGSISDDSDDEVLPKSQFVNTESESDNDADSDSDSDSDSASEDEHTQPQPLKTKAQQKMFADGPVPSKGQKQQQKTKRCVVRIKRLLQAEINRLQTSISQKKPNKRGRPRRSAESPPKKPKTDPTNSSSSSNSKAFIKVSGLQNGSPQQLAPPPNLGRKKRELTQQQMELRYGRRFFNLVVKIKRMRENIYMPKRTHNKSVSFNESIEIFGSKSRKSSYISVSSTSLCSQSTNVSSAVTVSSSGRSTTSATTSGSSRSTHSAAYKSSPSASNSSTLGASTSAAAYWATAAAPTSKWGSANSKPSSMKSSTPNKPSAAKSGASVPTRLQRVDATGNVLEDIDLGPNIPLDTSRNNKSSNRKRSSTSSCNGGGRAKKSSRTHLPSTIPVTADDDDEYIVPNEYNGASGSIQTQPQNIRHHKSGHHGASGSSKRSANSSGGRSKIQRRPSLYVPVTGLASLSIEDRQEDAESEATATTTTTTSGDADNSSGKSQAKKPTTSTTEKQPKATAQTITDPKPAEPVAVATKKTEPEKPKEKPYAEYAALLMPAPELPDSDRSKPAVGMLEPAVRISSREVSPFSLAIMDDVASADDILEIQTSIQDVRDLYTPPSRQATSALLRPPINRSTGLESPDSDYSFKSANEPDGNSTVLNDDDDDRTQSPNSQRLHISTPSTPSNDSTPSPTTSSVQQPQPNTLNGGNEATTTDSTANPTTNTSPTNTTNTVNMPPGLPSGEDIPNLDDVELGFWNPTSTPTLSTLPTNQINRHAISDTWRM